MTTNSVSTGVQRRRTEPVLRHKRRLATEFLSRGPDHHDVETPICPDADRILGPASNELAADRRRLETEERRERDRQRELELARARELARFD